MFRLVNGSAVARRGGREGGMRLTTVVSAQLIGLIFVDRARMGYFFGDAKFVQLVDDLARLHFQLSRQFIDSNLTHIEAFRLRAFTTCRYLPQRAALSEQTHTQGSGTAPSLDSAPVPPSTPSSFSCSEPESEAESGDSTIVSEALDSTPSDATPSSGTVSTGPASASPAAS